MSDDPRDTFKFYHYNPSLVAAAIFIVLFASSSALHTFQLVRTRTWYFIPFVIGGFFETIGYVGRALSSRESPDWTIGPYIMQSLLTLLAPALFAASIYMILARVIILTDGESHSLIRTRWVTKIFVTGDVLSFLAQSAGGGLLAKAKTASDSQMGEYVIIAGLGIQIVVFGFFIAVAGVFNLRIRKVPTMRSETVEVPWQMHLFVLYTASALIMVRSIFRVAEYVMGNDGILLQKEYYLYVFDATLMFIVMVLFNVWHPSKIISKKKSALANGVDVESVGSSYPLEDGREHKATKH